MSSQNRNVLTGSSAKITGMYKQKFALVGHPPDINLLRKLMAVTYEESFHEVSIITVHPLKYYEKVSRLNSGMWQKNEEKKRKKHLLVMIQK